MTDPRSTYKWRLLTRKLRANATTCPLCRNVFDHDNPRSRRYPTVDHITPLMHDGDPYDLTNLRVICLSCNASRGATHGNQRRHQPRPRPRPWHSRTW